jgi:hypothetical protein
MQPTKKEGRRSFLAGALLFGTLFTLFLAAAPASAQLDPGERRWILLTGKWTREAAADTPAWFDLSTWTLATKFDGPPPAVASDLQRVPWVPVAGDFDGDGVDTVMMFNRSTWRLVPAEGKPVEDSVAFDPEPDPWVPVAGDWDGSGMATVRVFDLRERSLRRLEDGPIRVDHYDPDPNPWRPLIGDFDGRGVDVVATWRDDEKTGASAAWVQVAGDWDGDGIDTFGAVHVATGQLLVGEPLALRSAAFDLASLFDKSGGGGGTGCWTFTKNFHQTVKIVGLGGGACMWMIFKTWEEWSCCALSPKPGGPSGCSMKPKFGQQVVTGYCP